MKIKREILEAFLTKASLNKRIKTINLDFTEEGVKSAVMDTSQIAVTFTSLSKEAFEEYKAFGEIYIKNSEQLLNYVKSFGDIIAIERIGDYKLKLSGNGREVFLMLGAKIVCDNKYEKPEPKLDWKTTLAIDKQVLYRPIQDMRVLETNWINITVKDKELILQVGDIDEADYTKQTTEAPEGEGQIKLGELIVDFYNSVEDKFTMSIGNNIPVLLKESTEFIDFTCVIAPIVSVE